MYKAAVIFSDTAVHFLFSVLVLRGKLVMYLMYIFVLYEICFYVLFKKKLFGNADLLWLKIILNTYKNLCIMLGINLTWSILRFKWGFFLLHVHHHVVQYLSICLSVCFMWCGKIIINVMDNNEFESKISCIAETTCRIWCYICSGTSYSG